MKIPEFLFALINPIVRTLLNSPAHGFLSGSIVALYFRGRKSGRALCTPVRYLREGDTLTVVTGADTQWWPNFIETQRIDVQLAGRRKAAQATAYRAPDPMVRAGLSNLLRAHPADAAYLEIHHDKGSGAIDGLWEADSYENALATAVVVVIELADDQRQ
ncbi:MAG: nitroreductase/quinone reductase family protein [Pseudomonadales bacterium]